MLDSLSYMLVLLNYTLDSLNFMLDLLKERLDLLNGRLNSLSNTLDCWMCPVESTGRDQWSLLCVRVLWSLLDVFL